MIDMSIRVSIGDPTTLLNEKKSLEKQLEIEQKNLVKLQKAVEAQKKFRVADKKKQNKPVRDAGRPPIEAIEPELHDVLIQIAETVACAADGRRRCEVIGTPITLDALHKKLEDMGIKISRSATYLRLVPRNSSTFEGRRHVRTVPMRLIKASNNQRNPHVFHFFIGHFYS